MDSINRIAEALERIAVALEREAATAVSSLSPLALSKADAARFLGVDEATIDQLLRTRRLAFAQHGEQRGRVIPVDALRRFLKEHLQSMGDEMKRRRERA